MTKDECKKVVLDIIADIAPDEDLSAVKPDVRLRDQLQLDSMDFLDIVMELRKRYGVQVPEEAYGELATLQGCVNYLGPMLAGKQLVVTSRA
jgi:acyl carrier protein